MRLVDLSLHFFPILVRVLAEHRQSSLELASFDLLEVDAMTVEPAMKIRQLGEDADRADHRERRGDDPRSHRRHHVTAARRDLVDRYGKRDVPLSNPTQLRG